MIILTKLLGIKLYIYVPNKIKYLLAGFFDLVYKEKLFITYLVMDFMVQKKHYHFLLIYCFRH